MFLFEEQCTAPGFGALLTASISGILFVDQSYRCVCMLVEQRVRACECVLILTCSL